MGSWAEDTGCCQIRRDLSGSKGRARAGGVWGKVLQLRTQAQRTCGIFRKQWAVGVAGVKRTRDGIRRVAGPGPGGPHRHVRTPWILLGERWGDLGSS